MGRVWCVCVNPCCCKHLVVGGSGNGLLLRTFSLSLLASSSYPCPPRNPPFSITDLQSNITSQRPQLRFNLFVGDLWLPRGVTACRAYCRAIHGASAVHQKCTRCLRPCCSYLLGLLDMIKCTSVRTQDFARGAIVQTRTIRCGRGSRAPRASKLSPYRSPTRGNTIWVP